jgi:SAM-dependent methyltransferase
MHLFNGWCTICEIETVFMAKHDWFRDHLLCTRCSSIPRERALMRVISERFPDYRNLIIHETSPGSRGVSAKLSSECEKYTISQYFKNINSGEFGQSGLRCENLEKLSFSDSSIDIFISQDVMEHVFDPVKAFQEIKRVLKPGGAHIFTVPLINKWKPTQRWASIGKDGVVVMFMLLFLMLMLIFYCNWYFYYC